MSTYFISALLLLFTFFIIQMKLFNKMALLIILWEYVLAWFIGF